ncbi:MAG TPA: amino acid adenylation domain-containing protein [Steroidobacteraceae bacterium]|jgi:amino acid adenylation domain-containing protein|nr:amino acid adenylation domain-containing protein [Steroidobacteraceae bacterium]
MNATSVLTVLFNKGVHVSTQDDELVIDAPKGALQAEDVMLIREHRDDIVDLLRQIKMQREAATPVISVQHDGHAALSDIQQNVLLMEGMAPSIPYGNIPLAFMIEGALDRAALGKSLDAVISMHEILRTTYVVRGDRTVQQIAPASSLPLAFTDFALEPDTEARIEAALRQHEARHFDLARELPVRAMLLRLAPGRYVLSLVFHQVAMDGHSCQLFVRYLSETYARIAAGSGESPAAFAGHQYVDFADWQRRSEKSPNYRQAVAFWKDSLAGAPALHGIPGDFLRPAIQTFAGRTLATELAAQDLARIEQFARDHETSVFTVLQAAFALLVARYSDCHDVVIGTAVANRTRREFFGTLGNLVNTLAFRFDLEAPRTFAGLVEHAKQVIDRAMQNQQVPFNVIVDQVRPARSFSHNPLVQLMLVIQEEEQTQLCLAGTTVTPMFRDPGVAKFDLTLHVYKQSGGAALRWEFNTALFRDNTVTRFARHFQELLLRCIASPEYDLAQLPLRVDRATGHGAPEASDFPAPVCIHDLIARQVRETPLNIAIADAHGHLTYAELEAQAERVASHLRAHRPRDQEFRVAIFCERSARLVVALYATLKAGGVYVPLDPAYPEARIGFMLEDSGASLVLGDGSAPQTTLPVLDLAALLAAEVSTPAVQTTAADSAYVIYTSGSTGKPKGVLVSHRSLFHSLSANKALMRFDASDEIPCLGSQAFGISLLEILLPLVSGACVRMLARDAIRDLDLLISSTQDATILHAVPSLMSRWLERVVEQGGGGYEKLRLLLVGGESVADDLLRAIRAWRPDVELIELYGMTESAVVCASYRPGANYSAHYCIGKPHPTASFYVLNRHLQQQPPGVPGELHIGGLSLASGYLNQPELTAQKFIPHPFATGERLYKTGDRVRLLHDGQFEFLGRVDHQVSLRGVRIEPGEIEALLAAHGDVKKAVAHVVKLPNGEATLVAYYTTGEPPADIATLNESLRGHLSRYLPDYMRPTLYQHLSALPLNPNGKVDRNALPMPVAHVRDAPPETPAERQLGHLWCSLLGIEVAGVEDNFFELGGNSLLGTQLIVQAEKLFGIELPVTALFESPTVRQLAKVVDQKLQLRAVSMLMYEAPGQAVATNEMLI